jgi:hypothetical protein
MYEPRKHIPWWWAPWLIDVVGLTACLAALYMIYLTLPANGWHL